MNARTRLLITTAALCHLLLAPALVTSQLQPAVLQAPPAAAPAKKTGAVKAGEPVLIRAREQEKHGGVYRLRGEAEIDFRNYVLRADEITYNEDTGDATLSGHVVLNGGPHDEHLTASHGTYNADNDTGRFYDVAGTTGARMRGRGVVLTSPNPFSFRGAVVDQQGRDKIVVHHGTVTSCALPQPKWSFHAEKVDVVPGENAKIYHTTFWLWRLPVFYFPFLDHPVERERKTGLLMPSYGHASIKGTIFGDGVFWAINRSLNATLGAEYFSKRGWAQNLTVEGRPSDGSSFSVNYFGVLDRGAEITQVVAGPGGSVITLPAHQDQGGEEVRINASGMLQPGVRAVADIDYLSSFLFRQAFFATINSEVRSTAFVSDNWRGYSLNLMTGRYQNFQSVASGDVITIVHAPSFEASTVDRQLFGSRFYWGFDAAAEGLSRREPSFVTGNVVGRFDLYPHLSLPLLWHGWTVLPDVALRDTWYGERLLPTSSIGAPSGTPVNRRALETSFELRPPALERVLDTTLFSRQFKHTIEPRVTYRYTTGVENFPNILRFDARDILSDTNEVEYALVNRLYDKRVGKGCAGSTSAAPEPKAEAADDNFAPAPSSASQPDPPKPATVDCSSREVLTWELAQKYFIDPTFGGALVPGRRNVFTTTEELTGIAFLTEARSFSPIISRLRMRGPSVDVEWQLDYDTKKGRINSSAALINHKFPGDFSLGVGHFYLQSPGEIVSPSLTTLAGPSKFDQMRLVASYGHPNKRGFTVAGSVGYDISLASPQMSAIQSTYNWDCCGLTFEYRRLNLGIRNENEFRFALSLANVGTFGTLRRQERLF